ncbi:hypothetical protein AB3A53_004384 [Vibrio vulnificus]|uniref:hypothetical protein n=1 Tax=Vibrio sp. SCSIO 43132 TaxID=2779363 RepID=UPI001CA83FB8|nr:hypothetical protein [Vibrio sp. SCSIO 43132]ELB2855426.1 hypothetical protein [Vibrio alginolyticus]UAB70126.1 hypothetical protein INR79_16760 [Vibrio sp. SCSIO 43132]
MNSGLVINFILVPAMIAYLLIALGFADMKKKGTSNIVFPLRDAIVATLALDLVVVVPSIFEVQNVGLGFDGVSFSAASLVLLCVHLSVLFGASKINAVLLQTEAKTKAKRLMNLVVVTYIGLLCLMTNAYSMQFVFQGIGG